MRVQGEDPEVAGPRTVAPPHLGLGFLYLAAVPTVFMGPTPTPHRPQSPVGLPSCCPHPSPWPQDARAPLPTAMHTQVAPGRAVSAPAARVGSSCVHSDSAQGTTPRAFSPHPLLDRPQLIPGPRGLSDALVTRGPHAGPTVCQGGVQSMAQHPGSWPACPWSVPLGLCQCLLPHQALPPAHLEPPRPPGAG